MRGLLRGMFCDLIECIGRGDFGYMKKWGCWKTKMYGKYAILAVCLDHSIMNEKALSTSNAPYLPVHVCVVAASHSCAGAKKTHQNCLELNNSQHITVKYFYICESWQYVKIRVTG